MKPQIYVNLLWGYGKYQLKGTTERNNAKPFVGCPTCLVEMNACGMVMIMSMLIGMLTIVAMVVMLVMVLVMMLMEMVVMVVMVMSESHPPA